MKQIRLDQISLTEYAQMTRNVSTRTRLELTCPLVMCLSLSVLLDSMSFTAVSIDILENEGVHVAFHCSPASMVAKKSNMNKFKRVSPHGLHTLI